MTDNTLPWWRRARRRAYWMLTVVVAFVVARLPRRWSHWLGRRLAMIALRIRPLERARAQANLQLALPELTDADRQRLLTRSARRLGENIIDAVAGARLLAMPDLVVAEPNPATGGMTAAEFAAQLGRRGRGVLVLTGHIGCWELLGGWLAREIPRHGGGKLAVVTGTIHNPAVDRLVQERRGRLGLVTLPRDGGAAPLLRHLDAGGVVAVLMDQQTRVPNLPVPFFGQLAPTARGFAKLALARGVPVLPIAIGRQGDRHLVRHLPPLESEPDPAGARDDRRLGEFLASCNERLEQMIRRNPVEWVWFHQRWS